MNLFTRYCKIRNVFEGYKCDERFHRLDNNSFYGNSHSELITQARETYGVNDVNIKELGA